MGNSNNNNKQLDSLLKSKLNIFNEDFRNFASYERQKVAIDISNRNLHGQGLAAQLADKIEKKLCIQKFQGFIDENGFRKAGLTEIITRHYEKYPYTLSIECISNIYSDFAKGWERHYSSLKTIKRPQLNLGPEIEKQIISNTLQEYKSIYTHEWKILELRLKEIILKHNGINKNQEEFNQMDAENKINRIFISHSSIEKDYADAIVRLLTDMKVPESKIFCSSVKGFGIKPGENIISYLKQQLNDKVLVLFLLSESFYNSKYCLCEMGATWIKTNEHIPIIIPPFTFKDIEGVITGTQGLTICCKEDINSLKDKITELLNLEPVNLNIWESRRDEFLDKINKVIDKDNNIIAIVNKSKIEFDIPKILFKVIRNFEKKMLTTEDIYQLIDNEYGLNRSGIELFDIYDYLEGLESGGKIKKVKYDGAKIESTLWRAII